MPDITIDVHEFNCISGDEFIKIVIDKYNELLDSHGYFLLLVIHGYSTSHNDNSIKNRLRCLMESEYNNFLEVLYGEDEDRNPGVTYLRPIKLEKLRQIEKKKAMNGLSEKEKIRTLNGYEQKQTNNLETLLCKFCTNKKQKKKIYDKFCGRKYSKKMIEDALKSMIKCRKLETEENNGVRYYVSTKSTSQVSLP